MRIEERGSTHVYRQIKMLSEEELQLRESRCVYEQPAYCVAACPLKLDTKAMLKAAAAGDFDGARKYYEKIAPFPMLLSAGCEAPCTVRCKLGELGDAVAIREIEEAVATFGQPPRVRGLLRRKKRKTVAVFGSGLLSLFLAGELQKKAYPVTVFCKESDLTDYLAQETDYASPAILEAERVRLEGMDITFIFDTPLTGKFLREKRAEFDVICVSPGLFRSLYPGEQADSDLMYHRNSGLVTGETHGVMDAAFGAKKAALTVDRLAQNLDPANTRGEEGPVETRLYTNTKGVTALTRVPSEGLYTREQAAEEARRCIQCHCDECIKGCAYLQHYQKFPRVLTREIYNNVGIIMGDHMMNKPINACSLCGQCSVTCPNGYDMAEICHLARQNMVSTDKMPLAPHEFALLDMLFSNGDAFLCRPQPGIAQCKYVFFPGCQAAAIAPETVKAAYADLCDRLDGGVALLLGCCGAICDWAGRYELYDQTKTFLDRELAKLGDPIIIAGCPTCRKELSGHESVQITGIWDVLCDIGLPDGAVSLDRPMALHDSCGARGDEETQSAIRKLATQLGCALVETEYDGDRSPCCGYGGLTAYANREVASEMTDLCLNRSDKPYLSYCMACRDRFARQGRESRHILELVYGTDAGAPPDISEKRWNRLTLKNELLRELWLEEPLEMKLSYELNYTQEARQMMDERMILTSDVIAVIDELRETGECIRDEETGLLIARTRVGNATFWAKFTQEGPDSYTVHRAYSHRMNIVRRQG